MGVYCMMGFLFAVILLILQFQFSNSATVVVDGVSEWRNPTVQIGDSVIFQHKYQYDLYIFRTVRAFNNCDFSQATLLTKANSTSYIWHPSRKGFFYFSFNNGSSKACQDGQKLAVEVTSSAPPKSEAAPAPSPNPPPTMAPPRSSGGVVSSSPAFPWPFRPRDASTSPSPSPSDEMFPATSPMMPDKSGIPFINSNPAVPLPTGEVDSATIRPWPMSASPDRQVVGILAVQRALFCIILLVLF